MPYAIREGPDKFAHICSPLWAFSVHRHILSIESVSKQHLRPRSACANAQADLGLHCPQNAKGPFSCIPHHMAWLKLMQMSFSSFIPKNPDYGI